MYQGSLSRTAKQPDTPGNWMKSSSFADQFKSSWWNWEKLTEIWKHLQKSTIFLEDGDPTKLPSKTKFR